jgi:hypothetical protein
MTGKNRGDDDTFADFDSTEFEGKVGGSSRSNQSDDELEGFESMPDPRRAGAARPAFSDEDGDDVPPPPSGKARRDNVEDDSFNDFEEARPEDDEIEVVDGDDDRDSSADEEPDENQTKSGSPGFFEKYKKALLFGGLGIVGLAGAGLGAVAFFGEEEFVPSPPSPPPVVQTAPQLPPRPTPQPIVPGTPPGGSAPQVTPPVAPVVPQQAVVVPPPVVPVPVPPVPQLGGPAPSSVVPPTVSVVAPPTPPPEPSVPSEVTKVLEEVQGIGRRLSQMEERFVVRGELIQRFEQSDTRMSELARRVMQAETRLINVQEGISLLGSRFDQVVQEMNEKMKAAAPPPPTPTSSVRREPQQQPRQTASVPRADAPAPRREASAPQTVVRRDPAAQPSGRDVRIAATQPPQKPVILDGYILRGVSNGQALIESSRGGGIQQVAVGQSLTNGVTVRAIQSLGGEWVVVTNQGLIGP